GAGFCPSDYIVCPKLDVHALEVGQRLGAGHVRAEVVPFHLVAVAVDLDAVQAAADDIAAAGRRRADDVVRPRVNTISLVSHQLGPGDIDTDVVALDEIPSGGREKDAVVPIGSNEIAGAGDRSSDRVVRTACDDHALARHKGPVPQGLGAGHVGADEI